MNFLILQNIYKISSSLASSTSSHLSDSAYLIREAILEDINETQQDIAALNIIIETSIEPKVDIPSLQALRKMSTKLEQEYLSPTSPVSLPKYNRPSSSSRRLLPPIPPRKTSSIS